MNGPKRMRNLITGLAAVLAVAIAPIALAQPGAGNRDWTPAWTSQAQSVAADLGLNDEQKQKAVDAYLASRKKLQDAAEQQTGGDRQAQVGAMMKAAETERAALKSALSGILTAEQVEKAMPVLGSFGRQYDRYTTALMDLKLDADNQQKALVLVNQYAADTTAAREKAMAAEDWQTMRSAMEASKAKLDTALDEILDDAQLAAWKEATAWRGRGQGPRGGAGRPRDGAPEPGGAAAEGGASPADSSK